MLDARTSMILSRHDAITRRLLDRLTVLARDPRRGRERAATRASLLEHLADGELLADDAGVDVHPRRWMRRALRDASDDGLLSVVAAISRELATPAPAPTARAA